MDFFTENENKIPKSSGVRTRFAPSPTGFMHVGGMRTALYSYLIAKSLGGTFILRIEDTDQARFVEGATEVIFKTLRNAGLIYDEGPDVGGPVGPYTQSERKPLYRPYAEKLCETGHAYYCFCGHVEHDERDHSELGEVSQVADPCRNLPYDEAKARVDAGEAHVIRMKTPYEGETTFSDIIFGDITVENKTLDDMVLIKGDNLPTYNFANVIDDHLMGITHVIRGSEYLASAPKYNLLYNAFGWDIPTYITVSLIMRDAQHKLSKRHGDPTYEDLLTQGYVVDAIINYVALLGWSPGGERELFTLPELCESFDYMRISKSPAIFDIQKLTYFNAEYIRAMTPDQFAELAEPYIRQVITTPDADIKQLAELIQARCEKLTDIPEMLDFVAELPEYDTELFVHKKSKTDEKISLDVLGELIPVFSGLTEWTRDALYGCMVNLAEVKQVKNALIMWPARIAVSGKAVTPGGAAEICAVLGKDESLRRMAVAVKMLESL